MSKGFSLSNIGVSYGDKTVLNDIDLQIKPGEFVCLLGESGSGKTTLLNILAGLKKPTKGMAFWNDSEITKPSPERNVVFQDYSLFPWMTLRSNISLAIRKTLHLDKKKANHVADEYLDLVGLSGSYNKYPFELSGGMRQRGAIARALSVGADCLLLDEPFGALDPQNRAQLQDLILHICRTPKDKPITTIFVTHDINEAVYLGSRIIVLGSTPGRIIADISLDFPVQKDRGQWFYNPDVRAIVQNIEEAYHRDMLEKIGSLVQGGAAI